MFDKDSSDPGSGGGIMAGSGRQAHSWGMWVLLSFGFCGFMIYPTCSWVLCGLISRLDQNPDNSHKTHEPAG